MGNTFDEAYAGLTPIQREAADWGDGAALILAGPGAGKTRVLTIRIARLLKESPRRRFKILALTFTTKAAGEMRERVESLLPPGLADERTFIGTFHAFCTQILRQHGSHIGIRPDFGIYSQRADREALLADALRDAINRGESFSQTDVRWLDTIEEMKGKLISPEKAATRGRDTHMAEVYRLYEVKLREENVMDFNGIILETCRLLAKLPAIAARLRSSYLYWLIDEFQDTSPAQYWLLYYLSEGQFKNVFVVADDDQIIYQWAGASYRQIEKFRNQYKPALIQLVENHRCPPDIVTIANRLVAHNTQRTPEKAATVAARTSPAGIVPIRAFTTDEEERNVLAEEILTKGKAMWSRIAILGRSRALLVPMLECLKQKGVDATLVQRRDNFISPQFVWLESCLNQVLRPTNRRVFTVFVNASNRITGLELDPLILMAEAEASGQNFSEHWAMFAPSTGSEVAGKLAKLVGTLAQSRNNWKEVVRLAIPLLLETATVPEGTVSDATEDHTAWTSCIKEIRAETGQEPELPEIVQGLALRSKEPPRNPNSVTLLTVHISKGLEFDFVYVIGLAESEMPSWQSIKEGDASPEMEEERRNCFVAVTRTREQLNLSFAEHYRGRNREPSRFLKEMALIK
jgi:DNA helicase II / ATP-dependent DNA helicase PcrA